MKWIIWMNCLLTSGFAVFAQQRDAVISGNSWNGSDTVEVKVWPDHAGPDKDALIFRSSFQDGIGFRITIPSLSGPSRLSLTSRSGTWLLTDYYISPGDDVLIHAGAQPGVYRFSGRGASGFQTKYRMDSARLSAIQLRRQDTALKITTAPTLLNFLRSVSFQDKLTSVRLAEVEQSRNSISSEMYALYHNYITGQQMENRYRNLQYYFNRMDTVGRNALIAYAAQIQDALPVFPPYSKACLDAVLRKERVRWFLLRGQLPVYREMYEHLKGVYSGTFREAVITNYLLQSESAGETIAYEACVKDAMTWFESEQYNSYLREQISRFSRGAEVYPFELQDTSGHIFHLKDLTGKVLVMDFWFTGCSACKELAKDLIPVVRTFSGNPDVLFVSISVDKQKDRWIQSIRSGKYTHPGNLNLYTNGKGLTHPFITYYDFTGFPKQLLIDKNGRIFDIPPRPHTPKQADAFIHLINLALKDQCH